MTSQQPQTWRERFISRFYIYDMETQSLAGAEKKAIAFIEQELKAERERTLKQAIVAIENVSDYPHTPDMYREALQALKSKA